MAPSFHSGRGEAGGLFVSSRDDTPMKWPCVFRGRFIREQVDPRVQASWKRTYGRAAPFGDLRRQWREEHCSRLNPYGSEDCPYSERDCAIAFYKAVQHVTAERADTPMGLFKVVARSYAFDRAENKPLARDRVQTDVRPGDSGGGGVRDDEGSDDVPRPITRPVSIGDVLRSIDPRPRERPIDESKESAK